MDALTAALSIELVHEQLLLASIQLATLHVHLASAVTLHTITQQQWRRQNRLYSGHGMFISWVTARTHDEMQYVSATCPERRQLVWIQRENGCGTVNAVSLGSSVFDASDVSSTTSGSSDNSVADFSQYHTAVRSSISYLDTFKK